MEIASEVFDKLKMLGGIEHFCFGCTRPFNPNDATPCPTCGWLKCPHCGECSCNLPLKARIAIEQVFATFCLSCLPRSQCLLNPRKKRGGRVIRGVTRDAFIEFAEKFYLGLVEDYRAGRITFDKLLLEVERDTGLKWVFK